MNVCASILISAMIFAGATARGAEPLRRVGMIHIMGPIGPATAGYIARAIDVSAARGDACLIMQIDTPGGLLDSTEEIVQKLYASPVPTVVYVAPSGAIAGSAGTFITLASDVAVMAPNTTIGAAHPVQIGMGGDEKMDDVMKQKLENVWSSYIQNIAAKRGRNAEWAASAVRESASITAEKALDLNVIDLIAKDVPDLLTQLDGREVNGRKLKTAGAEVVEIPMSMGEELFQVLWRPEVMFLLMLVAIYGIIAEINHPGAVLPGVAGAIALLLFLYMSTILPVSVTGIALIVLAVLLFLVDLYAPTHGALTAGGIVAFFLGALMLFARSGPGYQLSVFWIIPATAATALFFFYVVGAGLRAQRLPVRAGRETMLGRVVPALGHIDSSGGRVFIEGEYWKAVSEVPVEKDQPVQVVGIEGLTLKVNPKTP